MDLGSPEALKGLVATGRGFDIMSRASVVKESHMGLIVGIPVTPRRMRNLALVHSKQRSYARYVGNFVAFAEDRLAAKRPRTHARNAEAAAQV